ncbi:MAG: hypothetical protein AB1592_07805 [Pseudomonadota bacterium]
MIARSSACGEWGRWAIRLLLAYALLIQGFAGPVAGTLHTLAAESLDGAQAMCLPSRQGDAGQQTPQPERAPHDLLCCLMGCAASAAVGLEPAAASVATPEPIVSRVTRQLADVSPLPVTKARGCEARGPPGIV